MYPFHMNHVSLSFSAENRQTLSSNSTLYAESSSDDSSKLDSAACCQRRSKLDDKRDNVRFGTTKYNFGGKTSACRQRYEMSCRGKSVWENVQHPVILVLTV